MAATGPKRCVDRLRGSAVRATDQVLGAEFCDTRNPVSQTYLSLEGGGGEGGGGEERRREEREREGREGRREGGERGKEGGGRDKQREVSEGREDRGES